MTVDRQSSPTQRKAELATIALRERSPTVARTAGYSRIKSFPGPAYTMRAKQEQQRHLVQEQAALEGPDEDSVLALHLQCLANAPTLKSVTDHVLINNILFFLEGAFLKLTGDEQLFAEEPVITQNGFQYFVTPVDGSAQPCAECQRCMETGLIARLLEKAADIPRNFEAERVAALARREGVYRPTRIGQTVPKHRMSRYFRNHRSERAEAMALLEQGEPKRQCMAIIYADSEL